MSEDVDYVIKVVAVGLGGVGKTSLIRRFALNSFDSNYLMTLGVDFTTKIINIDGKSIKIVCVDTAGQVYYGKIRPNYYSGCLGAFVVFDLTNRNSFDTLNSWIEELKTYLPDVPIAIVGNKLDLVEARRISSEEGKSFCDSKDVGYFETSAKTSENVDEVYTFLAKKILQSKT